MRRTAMSKGLSAVSRGWAAANAAASPCTASTSAPSALLLAALGPHARRSFIAAAIQQRAQPGMLRWARDVVHRHRQQLDELVRQGRQWELRLPAIACSITDTPSGQALLKSILPAYIMVQLLPGRFTVLAREAPPSPYHKHSLVGQQLARKRSAFTLPDFKMPAPLASLIEEVAIWLRGAYLAMLFAPVVMSAPFVFYCNYRREDWMQLLRWTLERAGPAFIKWGQWAATRPDMFPKDLCASLEALQSSAPSHPGHLSKVSIEESFGRPLNNLFDAFDLEPVASGSIAQVHRARLSAAGAALTGSRAGTTVAVKVRHPGVSVLMHRDFVLMQRAAHACSALPVLCDLRLEESIRQFGGPLKEQLDLRVEAQHLSRFKKNFRLWTNVEFPTPMFPLVASEVLVESFEEGDLISCFVNQPTYRHRTALAETGLNVYLQMLLKDNFIHADLHPGNILVREVDRGAFRGLKRCLHALLPVDFHPKVVLLDTGMIAELQKQDQLGLVEFFSALTQQDGERLARSCLALSEQHTCKDPVSFVEDMRLMFNELDPVTISTHTGDVMRDMIDVLRRHSVTLKSTVSTVVVTTLVLEGWSSKLDPDLRILDSMREMLPTRWSERISCTVDKIMSTGGVAVA